MTKRTTLPRAILAALALSAAACGEMLASPEARPEAIAASSPAPSSAPLETSGAASDAGGRSDAASVPDASPAAAPFAMLAFSDDFTRADGPLGNGWTEKTPGTFAIAAGRARQSVGGAVDRLAFRPDAFADVEVSAVALLKNTCCSARLFARVLPVSDTPGQLYAYELVLDAASVVVRLHKRLSTGSVVRELAGQALPVSLLAGVPYSIALRVMGRDPVTVEGSASALDGTPIAALRGSDGSGDRIVGAGRVGFAGDVNDQEIESFEVRTP